MTYLSSKSLLSNKVFFHELIIDVNLHLKHFKEQSTCFQNVFSLTYIFCISWHVVKKFATMDHQLGFPRAVGDLDFSPATADCLTLDFGPFEVVHRWKRMQDCNEFVGTR